VVADLEQYETTFRENAVDETVLPKLTAEDLKDLGITAVGHRRKLLEAIGELRAVTLTESPLSEVAATIASPSKDTTAERRQVTVMFSDLVGSTALSARMDPEDLREVISAYQKSVAETVQRFGGFVAKYMGDGVLIYFGYPHAHEDDAERAVRAGLELVAAIGALKTYAPLQTRVGIATGLVIVGDLIGSGASQEQAIVGETPNLAARLQGVAESNSVVIAESTRKLVGGLFELRDLGAQNLKGIAGPVRAWAALRPASVESRFDALHASGLTQLVGREEELELLLRRWSRAKSGEGQAVLLSGEAGIGKSRLTAALLERLVAEPHTRLRYFCSPQHTDSALYPIISQMERAAGFAHDDAALAKLDKLDAVLAQSLTPRQDATLFAEMLSLPNDGRYPALELLPQQRRQRTLEALTTQIEALSRLNPVLMIFEDAHWIDPTSLEALGRAVDRIRSLGVLLIITYRPEFEPPWIGRPHVTALTLNRLGEGEIAALIDGVTGNKALPAHIRRNIVERTDGIPLFVEEMTKAVLEAESEGDAQQTAAAVPPSALAVPASLHASLMARLDRLGSAKDVAQIGAAIGREFSHALLAAVMAEPGMDLQAALDRLVKAGLLFRQGVPPHASYLFKHALVQDAAYSTLLRDPRRALHARIAGTLEDQFAEISENHPELLARHFTEAGLIEKAALLWGKAGQRSLERSALVEAAAQFGRALGPMATLPGTPALRREQIRLQVAAITPLMYIKGYAAPETKAAVSQARLLIDQSEALGEPLDDPLLLFSVLYGFWVANYVAFNGGVMRGLAADFLALAEKQGATVPLIVGHRLMGTSLVCSGKMLEARALLDRAVAQYNPIKHRPLALRFGQDVRVAALSYRAMAHWMLGYPTAALTDAEAALADAREIGQAATLMYVLAHANWIYLWRGNYEEVDSVAGRLVTLAQDKGAMLWKAVGMANLGGLFTLTSNSDVLKAKAIETLSAGMTMFSSTGATVWMPWYQAHLGKVRAELGQFDKAWSDVQDAVTAIESSQERWSEAELHRLAGEVAFRSAEPLATSAEDYFARALAVARQQQAKSWELRAAMSMARLWRDQGKPQQARELLAPVYGWFTEGFDTRDLKEAKALLEELAA
jgi:class 3 adenylate cyclase/predicted ATPase